MTLAQLPAPRLITHPNQLRRLVDVLLNISRVAVDTESNSLYAYREQVCLIQFSTDKQDYLVDPLALKDLSPLATVFSSPRIEKIFHAAEYDLMCLKRDFGFEFANLFDTMVAARILGRDAIGLGSMLASEFGVRVNKRFQRANWGQRPLPTKMLSYAQLDTHYLIPLRARLSDELQKKDLWPLALEDFSRGCQVHVHNSNNKVLNCWRINGAHDLDPQNVAVLKELCFYRDQVAQSQNRPLFKVIGDQTLLAIAHDCPRDLDELKNIRGMTRAQLNRHGYSILEAVQRGLLSEPVHPPSSPRPNNGFLERLDALKHWRKTTARNMGVNSDVVLPRDLVYKIAEHNPQDVKELKPLLSEVPWRFEHFGEQIIAAMPKN